MAHEGLDDDSADKVDWRPGLSVADAKAKEGEDAAIEFEVRLGRAAAQVVTVDYATSDGSARAGEDYVAARGTRSSWLGSCRPGQVLAEPLPLAEEAVPAVIRPGPTFRSTIARS